MFISMLFVQLQHPEAAGTSAKNQDLQTVQVSHLQAFIQISDVSGLHEWANTFLVWYNVQTHSKGGPSFPVSIPNIWHPLSDLLPCCLITNSHAHSAVSVTFYSDNTFFFPICTISHCLKFTELPQQAASYPPKKRNSLHLLHIFWGFSYPFGLWHFTVFMSGRVFFLPSKLAYFGSGTSINFVTFLFILHCFWKHSGKLQQTYLFLAVFQIKRDIVLTFETKQSLTSSDYWNHWFTSLIFFVCVLVSSPGKLSSSENKIGEFLLLGMINMSICRQRNFK